MVENPISEGSLRSATVKTTLGKTVDHLLYPALFGSGLLLTGVFWKLGGWYIGTVAALLTHWGFVALLLLLERIRPFEPAWNRSDGQLVNDLLYQTVIPRLGTPLATVFIAGTVWVVAHFRLPAVTAVWSTWPLIVTVPLGLLVADLGMYLAHRWMHKVPLFWRFHVVHHSAGRLSAFNGARAHPINNFIYTLFGAPLPMLLGVPTEIMMWYGALILYGGPLTHANIRMKCGVFNYFLNTPELHRWHHSRHQQETDTNFGEATVVWDHVFRTYFHPADRRPHRDVGIDVSVSTNVIKQLFQPFMPAGHRAGQRTIPALPAGEAGAV